MMHTGNIPYLDFIAPGILAQSVLFVAIFTALTSSGNAISACAEIPRQPDSARGTGARQGFSAGIRSLSQTAIVYGLSLLLG